MFIEALFTVVKTWKQHKCPSTEEWIKKTKRKTRNYKTPRGEHRQHTLWHKSQQDPLRPTSQKIGNKSKNKQMGPNET